MNRERSSEVNLIFLGVVLLSMTALGARAQQSAPPTSKVAQCVLPPGFDQKAPAFDQDRFATFKQEANSGNSAAQCGLGLLYSNGWGVLQDYMQAIAWWRKSAEQGSAAARYFLGLMYVTGKGVAQQDYTQGAAWCRKSAEQGYALGQANLGTLYHEGQGLTQDDVQATAWWRKAANQGEAEAQYNLGVAYIHGQGVPQDYAEAYFWMDIAAVGSANGVKQEDLAKVRDATASRLTPADLSREQVGSTAIVFQASKATRFASNVRLFASRAQCPNI